MAEADGGLGRRHRQDQEAKICPTGVTRAGGEGHEIDVDGEKDQFTAGIG